MNTTHNSIAINTDITLNLRMIQLAATQKQSTEYLMREAIAQYVNREEKRAAYNWTGLQRGTTIKRPDCTPRLKKPMYGWRNWKRGLMRSHRHAIFRTTTHREKLK